MTNRLSNSGFTLIELMIVVGIIGILATTAYPSFAEPVFKARRLDGTTALLSLQLSQERWRSGNKAYGSLSDLRLATASMQKAYELQITDADAGGYIATATATGVQANDAPCKVLRLIMKSGDATHASGPDAQTTNDSATNKRCWNV